MPVLLFKAKYIELIEKGLKSQTIRLLKKQYYKVGQEITATNFRHKLKLKITRVYQKRLDEITKKEALADGFNSREDLISAIQKTYNKKDALFTIIKFKRAS